MVLHNSSSLAYCIEAGNYQSVKFVSADVYKHFSNTFQVVALYPRAHKIRRDNENVQPRFSTYIANHSLLVSPFCTMVICIHHKDELLCQGHSQNFHKYSVLNSPL